MKIAYPASAPDHSNPIKNKNLIGNYLIKHFEKAGVEVEIFPAKENLVLNYYLKFKKVNYKIFLRKNFLRQRSPKYLRELAKQISKKINNSDADVVFAFGSVPVAYLEVNKPIYFITDATFQNLLNFHDGFINLSKQTIINSNKIEQLAFANATKIFFSSDWAAESAIRNYGVPENKISVVPLGANLLSIPNYDQVESNLNLKSFKQINLLSIGKFWLRKGHDRSIEVLEFLLNKKVNASLTIIGSKLPKKWEEYSPFLRSKITVYDNLNKDNPNELVLMENILNKSHFLLLLSRCETFGHVICEANAFGIPVLASNIGGIPSAIRNGVNGFLISEEEMPSKIVNIILELRKNPDQYYQLSIQSKLEYENRLNWDNTVKMILNAIENK